MCITVEIHFIVKKIEFCSIAQPGEVNFDHVSSRRGVSHYRWLDPPWLALPGQAARAGNHCTARCKLHVAEQPTRHLFHFPNEDYLTVQLRQGDVCP
jgi:hypothetical protein